MQISWLGHACFKITHKDKTILVDPYDKDIGLKPPRAKADILIAARKKTTGIESVSGDYFLISNPGEYEVGGIFAYCFPVGEGEDRKIIYRLEIEEISIAHLSNLDRNLSDSELDDLENVDVLLIPVGGGDVLDAKKASTLIKEIEPRIVIPMYYKIKGLKKDLDPVDKFIKEMGVKDSAPVPKLTIKKKDLPQEETEVVILEPGNN